MAFTFNNPDEQQMSLFDAYDNLTDREKKFLEKSWSSYYSKNIFPKIDEAPYAALYSTKTPRPNSPVNVIISALIIKEFLGLSDAEVVASMMFDIRFQYACHTTAFLEQPISERTLNRFRERCSSYLAETGTDLLGDTILPLETDLSEIIKWDKSLKKLDTPAIIRNIKRMSRLEILYTSVANLVKELHKEKADLPERFRHYIKAEDRNEFIYLGKSEDTPEKIRIVSEDAAALKEICGEDYDESSSYQLLLRVLREE